MNIMNSISKYARMLLLAFACLLGINNSFSYDYMYSAYSIDGYWGDWDMSAYTYKGNINNFVIYSRNDHPSIFIMRIKADNYKAPYSWEIKDHIKNKTWFEYHGTVEYWVSETFPTIYEVLKKNRGFLVDNPETKFDDPAFHGKRVKRTADAKIKCRFDKDGNLETINLFFDGVAYGLAPAKM